MLPSRPQEKLTQGLESESEAAAISLCSVGQNGSRHCWSSRTLLSLLVHLVCVRQCLFQQLPRSCWRSSCWISFFEFWARCMTSCGGKRASLSWVPSLSPWLEIVRDRRGYQFVFGSSCLFSSWIPAFPCFQLCTLHFLPNLQPCWW